MTNEELFQIVRKADPLAATVASEQAPQVLLERVLAASGPESQQPTRAQRSRRRRLGLVAVALALAAVCAGLAVAATGWLTGAPAPPAVVTNFEGYTPQLGFHPNPGGAVLVAQDSDISLYATTNQEGTYCLIVNSPWKPPTTLDGGTCIPPAIASGRLIAGVLGGPANQPDGHATLVVGGRVDDSAASTVRFTAPGGEVIDRPVGTSGFFVAGIDAQVQPCTSSGWTPTFTVLDANGKELAQATIPLVQPVHNGRACLYSGLRS